jgi:hypothetical protein
VTGERSGQAGWLGPSEAVPKGAVEEAGFTSPSGGVRTPSAMRSRGLAARSDEKPLRAGSRSAGTFRACAIRSHPEGERLLLRPARSGRLWRFPEGDQPMERRRKAGQTERSRRGGHGAWARSVKTFQNVGDATNGTAGL